MMPCSFGEAPNWLPSWGAWVRWLRVEARGRAEEQLCVCAVPLLLFIAFSLLIPAVALSQDSGSAEREYHGRGVELTVTIHDSSGEVLSVPAVVKLLREGSIPDGQAETSRGNAVFVVTDIGEFTIDVKAAGYTDTQKDISIPAPGHVAVDVYLRADSGAKDGGVPPGKPILAPKAKEALDKGLKALADDKLDESQKYLKQALQLAPAHPDVLYLQGLVLMKQRSWEQAQSSLEKATQIDPTHEAALAALGMTFCDEGKYELAIAPLEKSLELENPKTESASAWQTQWMLAKAYYHQQQYDQALQASRGALAASRGKAPEIALLVAQSLTAVGRYEDAAQILRDFLREHSGQPEATTAQRWLANLAANGKIRAQ
jgi:Tfp pilus assembly protein PilF